jgi:hypothetical protein
MTGTVVKLPAKGSGPKMVLSRALGESDNIEHVLILCMYKTGEYAIDLSDMDSGDLCSYAMFLNAVAQENLFVTDEDLQDNP